MTTLAEIAEKANSWELDNLTGDGYRECNHGVLFLRLVDAQKAIIVRVKGCWCNSYTIKHVFVRCQVCQALMEFGNVTEEMVK